MKFLSQINVNTEYTLPIVDGTNGQVLATDGNGNVYWGSISVGATNLDGLTDVILTSPSSGQLLRYGIPPGSGETSPVWYNFTPNYLTPSSSIDNLGDVTITSATSGQILQYNGTAWVNTTLSTVEYVSKVQHIVKAGVAITKGQAVYVTSADGTNMIVGLASNASEATSSKVIGLAASNAATNDQIFVVTEGLLAGLNTSTATAGDPVWLGTNGNLIFGLLNKPASPAHLVYIGVVTRVQQNNGEIFVKVQNGIEIDEIHDVQISSPATGQLLRRDSDGYWKNWTPNFLVPSNVSGTTNYISKFTGANTVGNSQIFDNGTNVGIGTTSPTYKLQVNGDSYVGGNLTSTGYGFFNGEGLGTSIRVGGIYGNLGLYVASTYDMQFDLGWDGVFKFTRGNTERMRITSAGYVGIGTAAPNYKLDVNGSINIYSGNSLRWGSGDVEILNSGYSMLFSTYTGSALTEKMRITSAGNVGIGTTSPANTLQIGSVGATGYSGNRLAVGDGTNVVALHPGAVSYLTANGDIVVGAGGNTTNQVYVKSGGNVGIGTTSPNAKLDVNGAANATSFSSTALFIANADTSGSLQPDQGSPANKIYSFRWAGGEQGYIDTDAKITFAGFKTPTGTASQFLKANGTVDSSVYITSAALSGYATQAWVNSNFYTQGQIDDFFGGAEPISGYNKSNWDTAYNDKVNSASFNTTNGVLTLTQQDGGTVTVDLDGRYLTSDTDAQTLTWDGVSKTLGITNGNDVILSELATEDFVTSQGYVTSSHTHTIANVTGLQTALDGKVSKSGDTMTGSLTFADVADNVRLAKNVNWLNLYDPWGNLHLRNANSGYGNYIDGSVHYWRPHDGSSYWMTLNSTGLGIGTTAPQQKLDVDGNISLGSWTKPGSTYVGLRRADDGSFGGGGDSGLVIESYNHAAPYNGNYSQRVHLRTHLYNGGSHNVLTAYGINVGIGTSSPSEKLHVSGAAIFDGGSGNSSTDAVVYVTKSNNNDWGLYVNASGLDYGMYTRVSPSAGYAFAIHNGTTWTTRITGDGRLHLNQKDTIASYDSWLRLNQSGEYGSGVYTPYALRNDGPFDNYGGIYGYSTIRARKAQTAGSYASAALWTESYDATTTGIAFHISGNVGKFLEMRTDGILYWNGDAVLHSGNIGSYAWNSSNDGSGSGLDADLLDGQQGSYYQAAATAITTANIGSQSVAYAGEAGFVSNQGGQLLRFDNRTISPSETSAGYLQFGFTSWTNNNGAPYADYLHMRSYTDASGGSDNLIMFKKSGIGMRIWQQTFGSSTAYSSYADVWTTDNFSSTDVSNWNAAYNDKVNSASFNTTNGVLTLTQQDGGTVTVDLDGRYLTSDTDAQTLTWDPGSKTLGITNGNSVVLENLATEDYVTSQGYITGYTETDTLATVTGRGATTSTAVTFNGNVTLGNAADLSFVDLAGTFPTSGKGFDWTLNNDGARIYAIQPSSDSIDLVFQLRDNATTNDRFVFHVDEWQGAAYDKYPLIISGGTQFDLKDSNLYTNSVLRLSNSGVLQNVTGNISMFTNDSGYITGYTETDTLATVTGRGASTSSPITINGGGSQPLSLTTSSGSPWHLALVRSDLGLTSRVFAHNSPYNGWYFEHNISIAGNTNWHSGNDGSGSGLDADLLDGNHASAFATRQDGARYTTNFNSILSSGFFNAEGQPANAPDDYGQLIVAKGIDTGLQIFGGYDSNNLWFRGWGYGPEADGFHPWRKIWHDGNDGSGSGLDADLLDGNHASAFYLATNPSGYITGSYLDDYTRGAYRVISDYSSNTTWYIRSNGQFVFGTGHDWTASFRLNIDNGSGYGSNGSWAYFGQQDSNATNGTWRGVRIRKFAGGSAVDGDLSAGAYYIGTTRKDTNWDAAYTWGNHADAPYWNVSLTDAVQVEAQEVIFAGNVTIQGTLTESSSIRFKENIAPLEPSLDKVNQLEAVSYNKIGEDNREIGLIAEDVAELFPEVVTYNEEGQPQGIQYQRLSVILLKAVQELSQEVNELKKKLN